MPARLSLSGCVLRKQPDALSARVRRASRRGCSGGWFLRNKNGPGKNLPRPVKDFRQRLFVVVRRRIDLTDRGGLEIVQRIAGGKGARRVCGANWQRTATTAAQIGLDIGRAGSGIRRDIMFQRPGLLGAVNLAE